MSLATALKYHQAGELDRATALYEQTLQQEPGNADAWHLRGVALHQRGEHHAALASIERALKLNGRAAAFYNNLGSVHHALGQHAEAIRALQRASVLAPHDYETAWNLGQMLSAGGEQSAAAEAYIKACELAPSGTGMPERLVSQLLELAAKLCEMGESDTAIRLFAEISGRIPQAIIAADGERHAILLDFLRRLSRENREDTVLVACRMFLQTHDASPAIRFRYGHALDRSGQIEAAIDVYESVVQLDTTHAAAWHNLGNLHQSACRYRPAIDCYRRAISADPTSAGAWNNLGTALNETGETASAIEAFETALVHAPQMADAHFNLGNIHRHADHLELAATCYERALAITPHCTRTLVNLGVVRKHQRRLEESAACCERALTIHPDLPEARFNRGLLRLLLGDLGRGWDDYEFRQAQPTAEDRLPVPAWDGHDLPGGTLIVTAEQGVGDEVMFSSCLPDVADRCERCVVECDPRLMPLFERSFASITFIAKGTARGLLTKHNLPEPVRHLSIGSLPRFSRRRLADFPSSPRWLQADEEQSARWRSCFRDIEPPLATGRRLRVGIAWQGGLEAEVRRRRSTRLRQWAPLLEQTDISFINLQHGEASSQFAGQRECFGSHLLPLDGPDPLQDLDGMAALISALDLVITIDNSTAHLAGALGVPTWLLLCTASDWRWMLDREDTPWYDSLRILRQSQPGDWGSLFERVATELRHQPRRLDAA